MSISSSKDGATLRSCTEWKVFIGRRMGQELEVKEKKGLFQARSSLRGNGRSLIMLLTSSSYLPLGDGEGTGDRLSNWCVSENSRLIV